MTYLWLNRAGQVLVQSHPAQARVLLSGGMHHYADEDARLELARLGEVGTEPLSQLRHRVALPEEIWKRSMTLPRPAWLSASAPTPANASTALPRAKRTGSPVATSVTQNEQSFPVFWFVVPLLLVFAEALLPFLRTY